MCQSSRARLTSRARSRFTTDSLFDRIARVVCEAECLPGKELYRIVGGRAACRRHYRSGRVVNLAGGHGLLAHMCLLLDDSSEGAVVVDRRRPKSEATLSKALVAAWPRLDGRVSFALADVKDVALHADNLVVSVHACGSLTDVVLERAVSVRARVAVLPCCHDLARNDAGGLGGWMDGPLAVDATRAAMLRASGYDVRTQRLPPGITDKDRLLLGSPVRLEAP